MASAGPESGLTSVMATSMKSLAPLRKHSEAKGFLTCREARLVVSLYLSADGNLKDLMKAKVFWRNRQTGQYYAGSNGWSENISVAHDFETVESAVELARTERLVGMEVVLRYDDPACDLILPLRQRA
jgi:hypothetical protein